MSALGIASFIFAAVVLAEALTFALVVIKLVLPVRES